VEVVFFTEGGKEAGLGHISRCVALFDALSGQGIASQMVVDGDDSVAYVLGERPFTVSGWNRDSDAAASMACGAGMAVVDSYRAPLGVYAALSHAVGLPVYFDDDLRLDYPPGVVVNGSIQAPGMGYPAKEGVTYLLGPRFIPLRSAFRDVLPRKTRDGIGTIMITFGGDDVRDLTPVVLGVLVKRYPEVRKKVIVGKGFRNEERIRACADAETALVIAPDDRAMAEAMLDSDICVTAAGQTLYELARTGTPVVVVGVAENQAFNISGWIDGGLIRFAGWWHEPGLGGKIAEYIDALRDPQARSAMSAAGQATVDGRGSERLAETLCGMAEHGAH